MNRTPPTSNNAREALRPRYLVLILGPTASGKTDIAYQIACTLHTEIISVDSRQIYRELGIGANKPPAAYLETIPHHFINHTSVFEPYSAGQFARECRQLLTRRFAHHKVLIMTGGSLFYLHSTLFGLDPIPEVNPSIRRYLELRLAMDGLPSLVKWLRQIDPTTAQKIQLSNPVRVIRALEVYLATGKPLSSYWQHGRIPAPHQLHQIQLAQYKIRLLWFGIWWPRTQLYERIHQRTNSMIFRGLIEEARFWYPFAHLPALRTHGYQEFFPYFAGRISLPEAIYNVKRNICQYARRQITWLRRTYPICWQPPNHLTQTILSTLSEIWDNKADPSELHT